MPSVIASAVNNARANTQTVGVTITHGFTLVNGDILIAFIGMGDDPGTGWVDSTATFTQIANAASSTGNDRAVGALRKVITNAAGEPSTYTFRRSGNSATDNLAAVLVQVRGADNGTPEDATATTSAGSDDFTPANVSIDTVTAGAMVLAAHLGSAAAAGYAGGNARTAGAPNGGGYSIVNDETFDDSSNTFAIFLEVAVNPDVGAAGTKSPGTWTGTADDSTSEWHTIAVAVRPAVPTITDVESDEDFSDKDTAVTITGTTFEASQGAGTVELGDNATYASATKVSQTVTSWSATAIDFTAVLGGLTPGALWIFVTNNSGARNAPGFAVTVHRATAFVLQATGNIAASGANTTGQLTAPASGSFAGGRIQDDENPADTVDLTSGNYGEWEWSIAPVPANVAAGEVYEFRTVQAGLALDTYSVTPTWTIAAVSLLASRLPRSMGMMLTR